jgi:TolB protein
LKMLPPELNHRAQSMPIITVSVILLIATSLACGMAAKPVPVPTVNPLITPSVSVSGEGTLIFQSSRDGNSEIYRVQADGTGLTNLTNDPGDDTFAVWSPDGKQIAFISDRSGQENLYVMDSDGSNPRHLHDLEVSGRPAWSPDGKKIALSPGVIINADGSGEVPLTADIVGGCYNPAWSPDGAQIACQNRYSAIAVRNADLTGRNVNLEGQTRSLMVRQFNQFPTWSPGGARIAFLADDGYSSGHTEICIINPDLSGLVRLSDNEKGGRAPAWSPDGTKIAYITRQCTGLFQCGSAEIQVRNADGTEKIRLTYNDLEETELAWSPDGTRITFAASPAQTATPQPGQPASPQGLFIINADGSAQIQLVAPASDNGGLSWQPIAP